MNFFTLILTILLITISGSLSKPYLQNGGFTAQLIDRDSPLSPLYNPTNTRSTRLQSAFLRSMYRASLLSKRAGCTSKVEAPISGVQGEYLMIIKIGTPPVIVMGVADTGSDLTWAQCEPCIECYKQTGPPILVPANSSTYKPLACQTKPCEDLSENESSCDSKNMCHYKMHYGDGSHTMGDLAVETFSFGPTQLKNVVFGCGRDNNGTFNEDASGIIGLGGGPLSLVNQLKSVIKGKFSYCLIPNSDNSNQTSTIHFGDDVRVSGDDVVSTPLVQKQPSTYYFVTLESVSVGDVSNTPPSSKDSSNAGNVIVDSGTTLTLLPEDLYSDLSSGLTEAIRGKRVEDPQGFFGLCYEDLSLESVPVVVFRFDGADMNVPPENLFLEVVKGVSCLTVVPSQGIAIIGNLLQRNFLVGFDLVNQVVNFKPANCSQNM